VAKIRIDPFFSHPIADRFMNDANYWELAYHMVTKGQPMGWNGLYLLLQIASWTCRLMAVLAAVSTWEPKAAQAKQALEYAAYAYLGFDLLIVLGRHGVTCWRRKPEPHVDEDEEPEETIGSHKKPVGSNVLYLRPRRTQGDARWARTNAHRK
jgi:hypothetical protein